MLVLSRQRDEQLVFIVPPSAVPTQVNVVVVDVRRDNVRLGCDAPRPTVIHRREVFDSIVRERRIQHRQQTPTQILTSATFDVIDQLLLAQIPAA